jgi:integrase
MASIAKLSRDRRKKGAAYYIQFLDHNGKRRTTKGCPDKGVTEAKAAKIETVVERIKLGLAKEAELDELLGRPSQVGWEPHLLAFEASLKRKENTPKYNRQTISRIRTVLTGCGFDSLSDFDADAVEACVAEHCRDEDLGPRTYNHYLQAVDSFGNWLAHPKRRVLERNPFCGISRRNAETDVRHSRRALTQAEISLVIDTALKSKELVQCYDGVTRAQIYLLSYMTGLRKGEIASLTPANFKLDASQPVVIVAAKSSKRRRKDTLPLHADLVVEIRRWIKGMPQNEPLFPKLGERKAYVMIRRDLEAAGIPYETEEGLADFHAAGRHTHITGLLSNGVSLVAARELARHSDVRMTMRYTHIGLADQATAVNQLPSVQMPAILSDGCLQNEEEGCLRIVCTSSGAVRQSASAAGARRQQKGWASKRQNPRRGKGLDAWRQSPSSAGTARQKVEAAGIEPASRIVST